MSENKCLTIKLAEDTGYTLWLHKGKRKIGPPLDWQGPTPSFEESGIFIGKIPSEIYEYDIFPLFQSVGKIYSIELTKNRQRNNEDHALILYAEPNQAKIAISLFNELEIIPEVKLIVTSFFYSCRLFIGRISSNLTKDYILLELKKLTDGIVDIKIFNNKNQDSHNQKYCFVEYKNHDNAIRARKKLKTLNLSLDNQKIFVDWAKPEFSLQKKWFCGIKIVYKYVRRNASITELYRLFSFDNKIQILFFKKINNSVFVMYQSELEAMLICRMLEVKKDRIITYFGEENKDSKVYRINYYYELLALVDKD